MVRIEAVLMEVVEVRVVEVWTGRLEPGALVISETEGAEFW